MNRVRLPNALGPGLATTMLTLALAGCGNGPTPTAHQGPKEPGTINQDDANLLNFFSGQQSFAHNLYSSVTNSYLLREGLYSSTTPLVDENGYHFDTKGLSPDETGALVSHWGDFRDSPSGSMIVDTSAAGNNAFDAEMNTLAAG